MNIRRRRVMRDMVRGASRTLQRVWPNRIVRRAVLGAMMCASAAAVASCRQPAPAKQPLPERVDNLGGLVAQLSDAGGYFDTDNLISNELGYQQVLGAMDRLGVHGGAYIGVGPDQNFTYIAHVKPRIAFIVDIRRDNMLQLLMFKALFAVSRNRAEYLALWTGRPVPEQVASYTDRPIQAIVAWIDSTAVTESSAQRARATVDSVLRREMTQQGVPLSSDDFATIARFHTEFISSGLSLRFHSAGRASQPHHPTLRQLILEHDAEGNMRSYLATEANFRFVQSMQERNLIVPVTGDLSGARALPEIGRYLTAHGEQVSALYVSNVEDYLIRDGRFAQYAAVVRALPRTDNAVLIRSYFGGGFGHPEATPAYYATQLLQRMDTFAADSSVGGIRRYRDLVNRDWVPLRRE